jgi:hypothetical protein
MTQATVRYITNGYIVNWSGGSGGSIVVPPSVYAGSVPEVVYWLGRIFDPVANPGPMQRSAPEPQIIQPADDPLLGQQAQIIDIASGGFLVTQFPNLGTGARAIEIFCTNMDAVSDTLTQIYTPPA